MNKKREKIDAYHFCMWVNRFEKRGILVRTTESLVVVLLLNLLNSIIWMCTQPLCHVHHALDISLPFLCCSIVCNNRKSIKNTTKKIPWFFYIENVHWPNLKIMSIGRKDEWGIACSFFMIVRVKHVRIEMDWQDDKKEKTIKCISLASGKWNYNWSLCRASRRIYGRQWTYRVRIDSEISFAAQHNE